MATWRCPHCGMAQAETTRCWACSKTPAGCGTCRSFRRAVDGRLGVCAADRKRRIVHPDAIEACWEAPEVLTAQGGLFAGLAIADPGAGDLGHPEPEPLPARTWIAPIPMRVAARVGTVPGRGADGPVTVRTVAPWIAAAPPPPSEPLAWPVPEPSIALPLPEVDPAPEPWEERWDEVALASAGSDAPDPGPSPAPEPIVPRALAGLPESVSESEPAVIGAPGAMSRGRRSRGLVEAPPVPPAAPLRALAPADPALPEAVSPAGEPWRFPDAGSWPDATTWPEPGAWPELAGPGPSAPLLDLEGLRDLDRGGAVP